MIQNSFLIYALFKVFSVKSGKTSRKIYEVISTHTSTSRLDDNKFWLLQREFLRYIIPGQKTPCPMPFFCFCPSRDLCCFHDSVSPFQATAIRMNFFCQNPFFQLIHDLHRVFILMQNSKISFRLTGSKSQERVEIFFTKGI